MHGNDSLPEFRMKRQGQSPLRNKFVGRGILGGFDRGIGNAVGLGGFNDLRIKGIHEHIQLGIHQVFFISRRCLVDAVGIIEDHAQITDPAHAGMHTRRGQSGLNARIT